MRVSVCDHHRGKKNLRGCLCVREGLVLFLKVRLRAFASITNTLTALLFIDRM